MKCRRLACLRINRGSEISLLRPFNEKHDGVGAGKQIASTARGILIKILIELITFYHEIELLRFDLFFINQPAINYVQTNRSRTNGPQTFSLSIYFYACLL